MSTDVFCQKCGTRAAAGAPGGLCPRCLILEGLATPDADSDFDSGEIRNSLLRYFGDYELLNEIARGGMGVVYRARQLSLKRIVAVKLLPAGPLARQDHAARFRAEAETVAALQHPNIVTIYEIGEHDGQPYFSMDYIDGKNLAEMARGQPLPTTRAVAWLQAIARAVHYAHNRGVVHRDLKPSNILIDPFDQPRITDFGLAKWLQVESDLTVTGELLGTPSFMSPEQASGKKNCVGPASDIYSLGAILYFLLTGRPPFQAESLTETLVQVRTAEPVRLSRLNTSVPQDLETICSKCLDKEPSRRYSTAQELVDDLDLFAKREPIRARSIGPAARALRWCHRKPALASLTFATLLLLLIVLIGSPIAVFRIDRERRRAETIAQQEVRERQLAQSISTQLELQRAEDFLTADNEPPGLAHLARVLRRDPTNAVAAERLLSALTWRSFALPISPGFRFQALYYLAQLSPDGKCLVTGATNYGVQISDARTGRPLVPVFYHRDWVKTVAFSPDGGRIVTGSDDNTARVWDAHTGKAITGSLEHLGIVTMVQFSPDGQWVVTASDDGTARVWNAQTGLPATPPLDHESGVSCASFSPDGRKVLTASKDGYAHIFDAATGRRLVKSPDHESAVTRAEFSPDGTRFATVSRNGLLRVCDVESGSRIAERRYPSGVYWIRFSPDGSKLLTASEDRTAGLWNVNTLSALTPPLRHDAPVLRAEFSPDGGKVATASEDFTARIWDADTGAPLCSPMKHEGWVGICQFSRDGSRLQTLAEGHSVREWDARRGQARCDLTVEAPVNSVHFDRSGESVVVGSGDGMAALWNVRTARRLAKPMRHQRNVVTAEFSPNGQQILTASWDGTARLWDTATGEPVGETMQHPTELVNAIFSPDGLRIATIANDNNVRIWNSRGQSIGLLLKHHQPVKKALFSPDGSVLVTASTDGCRVWKLAAGQLAYPPIQPNEAIIAIDLSPDGEKLATTSKPGTAHLWNLKTGQELTQAMPHDSWVQSVRFSPDGKFVATGSDDRTARVWDAHTGQPFTEPLKHPGSVLSVRFSSDSQRLVTACQDGTARVWEARSGMALSEPFRHNAAVTDACFSPDGQHVLTASHDGTARVWETRTPALPVPQWFVELAESMAGQRYTTGGLLEPVTEKGFFDIKRSLAESHASDFYTRWGRWFMDDRTTRAICDGSPISVPEYVRTRVKAYSNSLHALQEAVALAPTNALALARWSQFLMAQSPTNLPRVDRITQRALEYSPEEPMSAVARADYLNRTGKLQDALTLLKTAGERSPTNPEFWLCYGVLLRFAGRWDEAYEKLTRTVALSSPDDEVSGFAHREALYNRWVVLQHLNRPDEALEDFVRRYHIPPRDPNAGPEQLDLSHFFNLSLDEGPLPDFNLKELPKGLHAFAGVKFDVRGLILVGHRPPDGSIEELPQRVEGIPVRIKCRRLHFLHSWAWGQSDKAGSYVMHYRSGRTDQVPIVSSVNVHGINWSPWRPRELGKQCEIAWQGHNEVTRANDGAVWLYKTTWDNPFPEDEVATIDFCSALTPAVPVLFAITAEP